MPKGQSRTGLARIIFTAAYNFHSSDYLHTASQCATQSSLYFIEGHGCFDSRTYLFSRPPDYERIMMMMTDAYDLDMGAYRPRSPIWRAEFSLFFGTFSSPDNG